MKRSLRLITVAFSISFAIMASLSLFAINQFTSLVDYSKQVDHTNAVIAAIYNIEGLIKEVDVREAAFMITKDSSSLENLQDISRAIIPAADSLKNLFGDDAEQRKRLILLKTVLTERKDLIRQNLQYLSAHDTANLSPYFAKGRSLRTQVTAHLNSMREIENQYLNNKFQTKLYYERITYSTIRYLLTIFAVVTIIIFLLMIRELKRRILYQDVLQEKMADLKRSHDELEQIAYAVSHDLQEPLRKIQIMSNRLVYVKKEEIDEDTRVTLDRINSSASRMHELIDDLMNLTSLVKEEQLEEVNLNEVFALAVADMNEKIKDQKAIINATYLPVIYGHSKQLQTMFKALLDNSLKFSREKVTPEISVSCKEVTSDELKELGINGGQKFFQITFADNGIGFENQFIDKMFRIFQILHKRESAYAGKGIGLAICQRVMVNHGGHITAFGEPGKGASFKLYFPSRTS